MSSQLVSVVCGVSLMILGVSTVREGMRSGSDAGVFGIFMFILGYALACAAWIFG
jgi:hypothetical protein